MSLQKPRRLLKSDNLSDFESGAHDLDSWLHKFAWENQRAHNSVTYVATVGDRVVGYYALAAGSVQKAAVSKNFAQRRPHEIPCILLARLAVDKRTRGQGIGTLLLRDALERAVSASETLGVAALLIHCRDKEAKKFYEYHTDVLESPLDPLQLILPMKSIRKLLG